MKVSTRIFVALNLLLFLLGGISPLVMGQSTIRGELVEAHEYHPFFKISNFRQEQEQGMHFKSDMIDLEQIRESSANSSDQFGSNLSIILRTKTGERPLSPSSIDQIGRSGSVKIFGSVPTGEPVEIYMVLTNHVRDRGSYLVSNVLTLDSPPSPVTARKMTDEEKAVFDKKLGVIKEKEMELKEKAEAAKEAAEEAALEAAKRAAQPPPSEVPTGYTRAEFNTFLIPGAPVMYGYDNQWLAAEVVLKDGDFITVCPEGSNTVLRFKDPSWIAVKNEVLAEVENNAEAYTSKLFLLPGGNLVLRDAIPARGQKITKGTPLYFEGNGYWVIGRFISADNDFAWVFVDGLHRANQIQIDQLAVRLQTLEDAKDPAKKKQWTEKLSEGMAKARTKQTELQQRQSDFFGSRSNSRKKSSPGSGSAGSNSAKLANNFNTLRTWKDKSGKFEVRARLVEKIDSQITLEKEDKKRITVELNKLSTEDQKFIEDLF